MISFNSIRFKFSILYVVILGFILVFYSAFLYLGLRHTLFSDLDAELKTKAFEVGDLIGSYLETLDKSPESLKLASEKVINASKTHFYGRDPGTLETRLLQVIDKYDLREDFLSVQDMQGQFITHSETMIPEISAQFTVMAKGLEQAPNGNVRFRTFKTAKYNIRAMALSYPSSERVRYRIFVATRLRHILHLLQKRLVFTATTIPVVLIFASFFGWVLSTRILKPVRAVANTARRITHEDLSARVEIRHMDTEMVALVESFNDMISRLEKSFRYISEFSSYVAHELKTPLAIIRGESEVAFKQCRTVQDYEKVLQNNLKEIQRMIRVIDDLLLLTTLDYDPKALTFERFEFYGFIRELVEGARILGQEKNISVDARFPKGKLEVRGDEVHLRRLFFNVIENAVKFSQEKQAVRIDVLLKDDGETVEVAVTDSGPGIPEQDLPRVFEKFFHRERTANRGRPGHGLGLSIAMAIAKVHRGDIRVQSRHHEGTTFLIILPVY